MTGVETMSAPLVVRSISRDDYDGWLPLWEGYNAFYGRTGATALSAEITATTWRRFFDPYEPVNALIAEGEDGLVGLAHYLYHRSTTSIEPNCYLQDLFTDPDARGSGAGAALIEAVRGHAEERGVANVYWMTHETNEVGRRLYDRVGKRTGFIEYDLLP